MKIFITIAVIQLQLISASTIAASTDGFVQIAHAAFSLNMKRFYVAGANNHYLPWGSHYEIDSVLDDAVALHLNVLRTFLGPVIGSLDGKTMPTIWNWQSTATSSELGTNGVYVLYWDTNTNRIAWNDGPNGLQRMDYVIARAENAHLKLLIAFMDYWAYTGGAQQMAEWYGHSDTDTFFFQDPRPRQDFKDFIGHILNHVNAYTGIAYKNDPTVFGWELMNEPTPGSDALTQAWVTEISTYVKSIDSKHLLSSGVPMFDGGTPGNVWNSLLAIPTIDFGVWHAYPAYHNVTPGVIMDHINQHCDVTKTLQKPVIMEEFGYSVTNQNQSDVYDNWTTTIYNNSRCGGWLFWRLTSKQDNGLYPEDSDGFDIHNDGSPSAIVLKNAAIRFQR